MIHHTKNVMLTNVTGIYGLNGDLLIPAYLGVRGELAIAPDGSPTT